MSTKATPENITRAMDQHVANGLIKGWRHWAAAPWKRGGTQRPFWLLVDLNAGGDVELKNLREAEIFTEALASAHRARLAAAEQVNQALATVDKAQNYESPDGSDNQEFDALRALADAVRAARPVAS